MDNRVPTTRTRSPIAAIRRRLEKLELEHLRNHAAELADIVERLQIDLEFAESCAMSWRDDCLRMMEQSLPDGAAIGLAKDGSLHVMKPDAGTAHNDLIAACKAIDTDFASTGSVTPESVDKVRAALAKAGAA